MKIIQLVHAYGNTIFCQSKEESKKFILMRQFDWMSCSCRDCMGTLDDLHIKMHLQAENTIIKTTKIFNEIFY